MIIAGLVLITASMAIYNELTEEPHLSGNNAASTLVIAA